MRSGSVSRSVVAGVFVLAMVGAACGGNDDTGGDTGGGGPTVTAKDFQFDPTTVSVSSGETTITVQNEGAVEHSFTLDDDSATVDVEPGETQTVTVNVTADAGFHCEYHPDQMTGTLTVG
jgi:plastocyanin